MKFIKKVLPYLLITSFAYIYSAHANKPAKKTAEAKPTLTNESNIGNGVTKLINVNGMVCAFCVDNLTKIFKKQAAVKDINIDLDHKLLTLQLKPGQDLSDDKISSLVKKAGYTVTKIVNKNS